MRVAVPQLVLRLALVGVVTVLLQVSAVTQLQIFGTNADLMPLVIAAVGLLAGSIAGACFGFAAGLFLDLALVQTVGLSLAGLRRRRLLGRALPRAARPAEHARAAGRRAPRPRRRR